MTNEQQRSPIFCLDKVKKHLYNTIWGIKPLLMSNEGNGFTSPIEMDLRGKKVLGTAIGRPLGIPCTKKEEKKIVLFVA